MKPNRYLIFISMGFELVGLIVGALYVGQLLDDKYGTRGLCVMVLIVACMVSWFLHLLFLLKRLEKTADQDN